MDKLSEISQISLFEELKKDELRTIDKMSEMRPIKKGAVIVSPERPIPALFLLKQGQVRLYRMNHQGRQFTVDILTNGNIFGETSSISLTDENVYAEAMTDTYVCIINVDEFELFIERHPKIALKLINILSNRLKETYSMSEKIALSDVKYRILFLLLKLSEKEGKRHHEWQSIEMKLTHADIANMVGSTRETTSAVLSSFKKQGIIKQEGFLSINADRAYKILDEI
ncbi:Crp/Fnr family transcriptional regulator [Marinococcus luteus]|uniref:Crp/Fnr family transcriptional regulator n=1 Tax=Marinococcus luteus TaxID=1122204 RepID=UPI002ACCE781|nr:Crp/Fnr family transcriptional regulator [Marinococcus luteus]MDZ5784451.1 Crp/Fnr family transcriptional regulator [Marinococcus luteus]